MVVEHNTGFPDRAGAVAAYNANSLHAGIVFRDNIVIQNQYGVVGDGTAPGSPTSRARAS